MDRIREHSVVAARALMATLPQLIEQAEAGKLAVPALMLRLAFEDVRKVVVEAEGRCGRVALQINQPIGLNQT